MHNDLVLLMMHICMGTHKFLTAYNCGHAWLQTLMFLSSVRTIQSLLRVQYNRCRHSIRRTFWFGRAFWGSHRESNITNKAAGHSDAAAEHAAQ
eukprot:1158081-Pelagomonas_calceolata.AAC.7